MRHRHHSESRDSIVLASARLLDGRAVDLYRESGQRAPAWAYLNALTHSDPNHLTSLTNQPRSLHPGGWDAVLAYLATELLTIAKRRQENVSLTQRAVLVPLEVALLGGEVDEPETPSQLAHLIINELHRQPSPDPRIPPA